MGQATSFRRRIRWWLLAGILGLSAGSIVFARTAGAVDDFQRTPFTYLVAIVTVLLLLAWFLLLSGLRWRARLTVLAVLVAGVAGIGALVRMDGLYGDFVPQFRWRWMPPRDFGLAEVKTAEGAGGPTVGLGATSPQDFPRFLGAGGRAVVEGVRLARDWSVQPPRQMWRQPIGAGWSGFSVVGRHAVTQEQRGEHEQVNCYELLTGRARWTHQDNVRFHETAGGDGPRATPTIDEGRVYALGATGLLNCLDGETGAVIWSRDILAEHQQRNLMWGKSCSPLVFGHLVVVSLGDAAEPSLAAYDKRTGQPAWQAGHDKPSYASPALATLAGREQILSVNAASVSGHDPADGRQLWQYAWPGETAKCSQPVPLEGSRVFVSAGYGVGCVLLQVSAGEGGQLSVTEVWRKRHMQARFSNVVVRDGFLYGLSEGVLECVELATGERQWRGGRYGHGQTLRVGDVLLVTTESGKVVLVAADPAEGRELARFTALAGKTWNNPALSGRHLLVRNDQEAACYELPVVQGAGPDSDPPGR